MKEYSAKANVMVGEIKSVTVHANNFGLDIYCTCGTRLTLPNRAIIHGDDPVAGDLIICHDHELFGMVQRGYTIVSKTGDNMAKFKKLFKAVRNRG